MIESVKRIVSKFSETEQIESTFKFVIWLSVLSLLSKGVAALFQKDEVVSGIIVFIIGFALMLQIFWFGLINLAIPFTEAIFPKTDFIETNRVLGNIEQPKRLKIMKKLLFTKQTLIFMLVYIGFYYFMERLFTALLLQTNI